MKEAYKRDLVDSWCADAGVAYVPTINVNQKPTIGEALWFTVAWEPEDTQPINFGGDTEETGLLAVIVAGEPNLGDQAVATAADQIVAALLAKVDATGALTLERAGTPAEHSAGTADRWYSLRTPIEYRLISGGG